jgi:hypothetical protein
MSRLNLPLGLAKVSSSVRNDTRSMKSMTGACSRRAFVQSASAFAAVLLWHAPAQALAADAAPVASPTGRGRNRFSHLRLRASQPQLLRKFYAETLGLPIVKSDGDSFSVVIGTSRIEFEQAPSGTEPFYHFAFNISENKFAAAKNWLKNRTPLLKDRAGQDEIFFKAWNAHAVYFKDPCGNIGELIARHTMDNARVGEFSVEDMLCVSEIGCPAEQPDEVSAVLESTFGLKRYLNSPMFVGDEHGLIILPPVGRPWIPENIQKAAAHPVDVVIRNEHEGRHATWASLPYTVRAVKDSL